nr:MAG TPA: hypothetical protein [Caudoviricetes sp.]
MYYSGVSNINTLGPLSFKRGLGFLFPLNP